VAHIDVLPDGRMTSIAAAAYVGLSVKTLAMRRCDGSGPRFVKPGGGRVFYYRADLDEWLTRISGTSTSQARLQRRNAASEPFGGNAARNP